jgi:hypothetical protein
MGEVWPNIFPIFSENLGITGFPKFSIKDLGKFMIKFPSQFL